MSRILVPGASGNVGKYVVEYALKNGQQVTAAGTHPDTLTKMFGNNENVRVVPFDFMDEKTYAKALQDVQAVFIMRPPHLGNPADLYPFIDTLKNSGKIKLISFLSLIGIEHNPVPPHYKIEKYIEKSGVPYCHIRPSFFMQNLSGVHAFEIKHFNKIVVPVKKALTSFIDAEDIGELIAKVLTNPAKHQNTAYAITGSEAIDYDQVADTLSEVLQRKISYANLAPRLAKKYWITIRGLDKEYATVMGMLYMMTRLGTAKKVTDTFNVIMGKNPRSFATFVKKNAAAWQ